LKNLTGNYKIIKDVDGSTKIKNFCFSLPTENRWSKTSAIK